MWCFRRRLLAELDDIRWLATRNHQLLRRILENDMATNDELNEINANLTEAQGELAGLPDQIAELIAAAGDNADPALVESILAKSQALKNIVPDAPNPAPEPAVDETPAEAPADEAPAEEVETPAEEAPAEQAEAPAEEAPAPDITPDTR